MPKPESVLARATAKGVNYESSGSSGGVRSFSAAEVGHALAGYSNGDEYYQIPEGSYRLLLYRYASGTEQDLEILLRELLAIFKKKNDWTYRAALTVIAKHAIREFMTARRCDSCHGRQVIKQADLIKQCGTCLGSGYHPLSAAARAKDLNIPVTTFKTRGAQTYYQQCLRTLVEWEEKGARRVMAKTRE